MTDVTVVIPTLGRPSLFELVAALPEGTPTLVVDDRADPRAAPLDLPPHVRVLPGRAAGPAAARNVGWRAARTEWVVFLDDDVLPGDDWAQQLAADLRDAGPDVGGVQATLRVPLTPGRRPTDWERVTAALADGEWITADMAYRRSALALTGGFDERLPRAFREDAELAHRVREAGFLLRRGLRETTHPVRGESRWVSVRTQRGNADDALLRHLYGPRWRAVLEIPPGRRRRHAAVTAAGAAALTAAAARLVTGHRPFTAVAALAGLVWAAGTAEFAAARIAPGPRDRREVTTMLLTSAAIPPVAVAHWLRGWARWRGAEPIPPNVTSDGQSPARRAVDTTVTGTRDLTEAHR
ncbi:putative glycosyltransferase [Actinoplanes missouriensis 431]|uniref:Putative glycosyltransferase n=1 Tax=Actinoplanes missouriensis (strain ATCC 14538 / DSM 43046 / CBS 188.64 / JCM 3121 / NBRC 102363 / NCIMB 12654 / NRRL B-3342 / UNCC 431) TaxID=512565 RepID=I0HB50_ACTM4|nr:glycosyltransferase [Actinoplanes missouriensis]BAL90237.1 putative glycosyltransferase [Actinoplanes missouriensis 431]